jgi:hypothetical protein
MVSILSDPFIAIFADQDGTVILSPFRKWLVFQLQQLVTFATVEKSISSPITECHLFSYLLLFTSCFLCTHLIIS